VIITGFLVMIEPTEGSAVMIVTTENSASDDGDSNSASDDHSVMTYQ